MSLKMEDVIRAISEEKAAWSRMVNDIPIEHAQDRTYNQSRRDAANTALLNLITRISQIAEEEE